MSLLLQHIIDALSFGGLYALIALGIALILGIMRLINLAHGELVMAGGYTLFVFEQQSWLIALFAVLAVATLLALISERVAFRPVRGSAPETLLVTSVALSFLLQNVVILVFGAQAKSVGLPDFLGRTVVVGGLRIAVPTILAVVVAPLLLAGTALLLRRTRMGLHMRAAAEDLPMARMLGVGGSRVISAAFALSGLLAGAVALLLVYQTSALSPTMGLIPVLIGFIATVLGGMGSLTGAAVGGFFVGVVTVLLQVVLPSELRPFREALLFASIVAVLLLRPQGILGTRFVERV